MQNLLTTLLGVFLCLPALAQEAAAPAVAPATAPAAPEKCFPSGSSLTRAEMSTTGNHVLVGNVLGLGKVFDTRTLQLVAASKDWKWDDLHQWFPKVPAAAGQPAYRLEIKKLNAEPYPPQLFQVLDAQGKVVAEAQTKSVEYHSFDPTTGVLVVSPGYDVFLVRPGQRQKRIAKDEDTWRIAGATNFSPDGRYLVSGVGDVANLREGVVRRHVFVGERDKLMTILFNAASTEFTVNNNSRGLVTYELATSKEVRCIPIPADLPRIQGFEVLMAPNGQDFLYWLCFNKQASGGLAYWVHDGKGTSLCDPLWTKEQDANFAELVKEALARLEREAQAAAEAAEQARLKPPPPSAPPAASRALVRCTTCNGRGTVTVTESQPVQFYKNDKVDAYGQSRQVLVGQGARTTTSQVRCGRCGGTGQVRP